MIICKWITESEIEFTYHDNLQDAELYIDVISDNFHSVEFSELIDSDNLTASNFNFFLD